VCCSVLQCVAVCCSVLQYVAVCCSWLQGPRLQHSPPPSYVSASHVVCCSVLQFVAVRCSMLQCVAVRYKDRASNILHHPHTYKPCVAVCCSVLQCVAVCCSVLQCVAVCCSVLQYVSVGYKDHASNILHHLHTYK